MERLAPLFPVTVVAAVVLFVAREVVEDIKRRRANARKGRAFRTLLARECELNHLAHKRLTEALLKIQEAFRDGVAADYKISSQGPEIWYSDKSTRADWLLSFLCRTYATNLWAT